MARKEALLNKTVFMKDMTRSTNQVRALAARNGQQQFDKAAKNFIKEFDKHPVTQEIQSKGETGNISGTLGRIGEDNEEANLWGFIGFESRTKPIQTLRTHLKNNLEGPKTTDKAANTQITGSKVRFTFKVKIPDLAQIAAKTIMPWENKSWVDGVESSGISGLGAYIYWKTGWTREQSRSGGSDTQGKILGDRSQMARLRTDTFEVTPYLADMLSRFSNKLREG
jgi:hypothetical protein